MLATPNAASGNLRQPFNYGQMRRNATTIFAFSFASNIRLAVNGLGFAPPSASHIGLLNREAHEIILAVPVPESAKRMLAVVHYLLVGIAM